MSQCIHLNEWTNSIQDVCGNFQTIFKQQSTLFIGEVDAHLIGKTEIAFIKSNAHYIARKKGIPDRVKERFCFLVLQNSGRMTIHHQNLKLNLREGDLVLLDPEEDIEMFPEGLFTHISVHLSREKLLRFGINQNSIGKINTHNMSGHLIKTLLNSMSAESIALWNAQQDGEAFEDALIALIQPTHRYAHECHVQKDLLFQDAERFILEHLQDIQLSAQRVAAHVGVSLRHLYRLFAQQNITIQQYIMDQRLEHIKKMLADHNYQNQSITQVAMQFGFQDSAHFSKKFKQKFGMTPKAYKSGSLGLNIADHVIH